MSKNAFRTPAVGAADPNFANETSGFNVIPFASMAGGWLGPLLMFWLYVWGPLRPFHYPSGELLPPLPLLIAGFAAGVAVWWMPASYYRVRRFEQNGRLYAWRFSKERGPRRICRQVRAFATRARGFQKGGAT